MIKDYLKENQPLFYRIIENEFNLKKIPHAFLLVGNNTDQPLQFLTMSLICNETLACEQCIDCKKVLNHQYADIIEIDGEEESIKKKHIENIQETFKKSSLEGKAKVYILKNVEKTTKEAMNALLKILEEPTECIYAIFTTKNINRILPTIISRCQVIELKPDNKEVLKEKLIAKGYEEEKASVLSYIIKDEDDLENLNQDNFDDIMLQAINFIEDLFLYRENLIINTQIHLLKDHKEKENIKLFINLIILALKDMFHVKQNPTDIPQKFRKMLYKGGKSCYNERVFVCVMHTFNQIRCAPGKTGRNPTSGTPQERRKQREYGVCSSEPERRRGKIHHRGQSGRLSRLSWQACALRGHRSPGQHHDRSRHQEKTAPRLIL
mgnify:CR=1 FL=1